MMSEDMPNMDEIDRKLLAEQEEFLAGGYGQGQGKDDELEFPVVDQDQDLEQFQPEVIFAKSKESTSKPVYVQKFSNDNLLAEAIIVGGIPFFAVSMCY
jgi:hypothetical protein